MEHYQNRGAKRNGYDGMANALHLLRAGKVKTSFVTHSIARSLVWSICRGLKSNLDFPCHLPHFYHHITFDSPILLVIVQFPLPLFTDHFTVQKCIIVPTQLLRDRLQSQDPLWHVRVRQGVSRRLQDELLQEEPHLDQHHLLRRAQWLDGSFRMLVILTNTMQQFAFDGRRCSLNSI